MFSGIGDTYWDTNIPLITTLMSTLSCIKSNDTMASLPRNVSWWISIMILMN